MSSRNRWLAWCRRTNLQSAVCSRESCFILPLSRSRTYDQFGCLVPNSVNVSSSQNVLRTSVGRNFSRPLYLAEPHLQPSWLIRSACKAPCLPFHKGQSPRMPVLHTSSATNCSRAKTVAPLTYQRRRRWLQVEAMFTHSEAIMEQSAWHKPLHP